MTQEVNLLQSNEIVGAGGHVTTEAPAQGEKGVERRTHYR